MKKVCGLAAMAVAALYLAVWLHEVGHASSAYLLGCKANWWSTYTTWYLAGSGPGPIRLRCLEARGPGAMALVGGAGILSNLVFLAAAILVARQSAAREAAPGPDFRLLHSSSSLLLPAVVLALVEAAVAFSYLLLNGFVPRADVAILISTTGLGAWFWGTLGLLLAAAAAAALRRPLAAAAVSLDPGAAAQWRRRLVLAAIALTLAIGGYRVLAHPAPTAGPIAFQFQ